VILDHFGAPAREVVQHEVHSRGVDERRVARQSHKNGGVKLAGCLGKAAKHVKPVPADYRDTEIARELRYGIIRRVYGRRHGYARGQPARPHPFEEPGEKRPPTEVGQHLAGEPRGTRPGLDHYYGR